MTKFGDDWLSRSWDFVKFPYKQTDKLTNRQTWPTNILAKMVILASNKQTNRQTRPTNILAKIKFWQVIMMTKFAGDYLGCHVTTQVVTGCTWVTTPNLVKMTTYSFHWVWKSLSPSFITLAPDRYGNNCKSVIFAEHKLRLSSWAILMKKISSECQRTRWRQVNIGLGNGFVPSG